MRPRLSLPLPHEVLSARESLLAQQYLSEVPSHHIGSLNITTPPQLVAFVTSYNLLSLKRSYSPKYVCLSLTNIIHGL